MKRDMDLVRKILQAYEACDEWKVEGEIAIEGYRKEEIEYHQQIMRDAGFLQPAVSWLLMGSQGEIGTRLTWAGHDFLDASREESRWSKAKDIGVRIGGVSLEIMVQILKDLMLSQVKQVMG